MTLVEKPHLFLYQLASVDVWKGALVRLEGGLVRDVHSMLILPLQWPRFT